ncbi:MAG: FecR domain-containing protein, partial [Burkholderiales bacterium]|nr:FecR domain-containing protein [Burkholderiales bacterium]
RLAFERCTDTWQDVSGLKLSTYASATHVQRPRKTTGISNRRIALTSAALAGAALLAWRPWAPGDIYETGIGEQRAVMLPDGTRMTLNTATRVRVALTKAQRMLSVLQGEALFEVAKDPDRPFVVQVADVNVVATGTSFLIRATPRANGGGDAFGVTLIEGQVIVRRAGGVTQSMLGESRVMAPGERLRVALSHKAGVAGDLPRERLDRPRIDQLTAWQRGEVVLDSMPLPEAVAEMNRYSSAAIDVAPIEKLRSLRVSGVFRAGDSEAFCRAVAALHGLTVRVSAGRWEIVPG